MTPALKAVLLSPFTPASLYRATPGIWLDPGAFGTGFQDDAGTTPQTDSSQTTGKRLDRSGSGNHFVQSVEASRPTLSAPPYSDVYAGTQSLVLASFAGTSGVDCFVAVKRNSVAKGVLFSPSTTSQYLGLFDPADAVSQASSAGAATGNYLVDGIALTGGGAATAATLATALGTGVWHILEMRDVNLSTWTAFYISGRTSNQINASLGPMVLCAAQNDSVRAKIRRYLANKVGATV